MSWYSLRVISGKEKATKDNILREAEEAKIETDIEEVPITIVKTGCPFYHGYKNDYKFD